MTTPHETVSLQPDPTAMQMDFNQLGWVGIDADAPEVVSLREYLNENSGIKGLQVLLPDEVDLAVRLFYRDGFVVVRDVLNPHQLEFLRRGSEREIRNILSMDAQRIGNRGSHRYSFGGASLTGHLMHLPEWAMLIDLPTVTPILEAIFGSPNYIARGGGGDFCLPGAFAYQALHSDMRDRTVVDLTGNGKMHTFGSFHDPSGRLNYRDLPCPYVCCNFLTTDFESCNGPTRQIPGTQQSQQPMPPFKDEPAWMKLSAVCPAPAGSVLIRDVRTWHGGTPNLSDEVRAIPNAEFYAPWYREPLTKCMPRSIYDGLSEHGKDVCHSIIADSSETVVTGYREDIGMSRVVNASLRSDA